MRLFQQQIAIWCVCLFFLASCQTKPTPTGSPTSPTPTKLTSPTSTTTLVPKSTNTPTQAVSLLTPSNTPVPVPAAHLMWVDPVNEMTHIDGYVGAWSPVTNEFVAGYHCPIIEEAADEFLFVASAPDFIPKKIILPKERCFTHVGGFRWRPNGQQLLANSFIPESPEFMLGVVDSSNYLLIDRNTYEIDYTVTGWLFWGGWLDNNTFVYQDYQGGGSSTLHIFDIENDKELGWARTYEHGISDIHGSYVVADNGVACWSVSAMVFSEVPVRPIDSIISAYSKHLSIRLEPWEHLFNSSFEDWLDDYNQMLVLTWAADVRTDRMNVLHDVPVTDLQIWDVATDELTMLIPDSIYGRVSPDRQYLIYLTPASTAPQLHIVDRVTGETVFSQPIYATNEKLCTVSAFTSFSPDGRYLTFYGSENELLIYDLRERTLSAPLPAIPSIPVWSPTSQHFIYRDATDSLALLTVTENAGRLSSPLTTDHIHLTNPQWSYDGQYLTVTTSREEGSQTVVLQVR